MGKWDIKLDRSIRGDFLLTIACHEAAHAVVGQDAGRRVEFARVCEGDEMSSRHLAGEVAFVDKKVPLIYASQEMVARLAGTAFNRLLMEGRRRGHRRKPFGKDRVNDWQNARRYAVALHEMCLKHNMECYSVRKTMSNCLELARQRVAENWDTIIALGRELAVRKTMTGDEVREFIGGGQNNPFPKQKP